MKTLNYDPAHILHSYPRQCPIPKKLKKSAQESAERTVERRVEREASKKTDKTIDSVFEKKETNNGEAVERSTPLL